MADLRTVFIGLSGGLGPVFRTLPIADRLRKIGYDIYFSVYGEQSARFIEKMGYKHLEDDDPVFPNPKKMIPAGENFFNLEHYFAQSGLLDEQFVQSWVCHRINMIKQINPDFVIADMSPHTILASKYLNLPSVSITQSCFHPEGESLFLCHEIPRNIPKVTPIVNKVLQRLGLSKIDKIEELSRGDVDVIPSFPEMDPISSLKPHYVGAIEYTVPNEAHLDFLNGKSFILVYPGRLQDGAGNSGLRLLNVVKEAFQDKDRHIVVASNENLPEDWKKDLSRNIHLIPYFNINLLQKAELFIHHGGHGSCLSGIRNNIPSLVIPTHTERLFNARKLHQLGAGEYMLPDTIISDYFYQLCEYMIHDGYKKRLRQLNERLLEKNYRGADQVIEILKWEGYLI